MPGNPQNAPAKTPARRVPGWPWWASLIVLLAVNYLVVLMFTPGTGSRVEVSYTFFRQQVTAGNVAEVSTQGDTIQGSLRQTATYPPGGGDTAKQVTDFSTVRPAFADPGLETLLDAQGVTINAKPVDQPANPLLNLLLGFGPTLLLIGAFFWISGRMGG